MMQGDAYYLGFQIVNNAGNPVTPDDVLDVEITIGNLIKNYRMAQVIYTDGLWLFPLSQEETFAFRPSAQKAQTRVVWKNGIVEGKPIYGVRIEESGSKEVL